MQSIEEAPMADPRPMTPEEMQNFEDDELHHVRPDDHFPASESEEVSTGEGGAPTVPITNPD
jgi:hypothetical protein